ncbi:hypothetical protein [Erythrobacter sp. Alg231-14]|uniref:hypothetical protein n=1 Tax=Erythrobacter sp. Alg231-14 TaxID=1922225 RepID=UPI000D54CED6
MSVITIGILFASIGLILVATYLDLPYFGDGAGALLVAGLCYSFVVAKREAALLTYVLSEDQIFEEDEPRAKAPVPEGLGEIPRSRSV